MIVYVYIVWHFVRAAGFMFVYNSWGHNMLYYFIDADENSRETAHLLRVGWCVIHLSAVGQKLHGKISQD